MLLTGRLGHENFSFETFWNVVIMVNESGWYEGTPTCTLKKEGDEDFQSVLRRCSAQE